jgi:RNA polymerase sigma-70 factor (ECF subfamily)
MDEKQWLVDRFEEHRPRLQALAYRMLGSLADADDAVQDTWLRVSRAGGADIENLGGWFTTIASRVCLNQLRSRNVRREQPLDAHVPDPVISREPGLQPEEEALMADSVGLALLVVLDTLSPAERLAFVLHDMFDLPFDEIAPMIDRTPEAARQLASRARRRVRSAEPPGRDPDLKRQREVVDAFFRAARGGDFDGLVAVLDPDVVLRADFGVWRPAASRVARGAEAVAGQAMLAALPHAILHPALVNGAAGVVVTVDGRPFAVMGFLVVEGRIAEIDVVAERERVRSLTASFFGDENPAWQKARAELGEALLLRFGQGPFQSWARLPDYLAARPRALYSASSLSCLRQAASDNSCSPAVTRH